MIYMPWIKYSTVMYMPWIKYSTVITISICRTAVLMDRVSLRAADAEVTARSWDFVSPKTLEYLLADVSSVIEANKCHTAEVR